MSWGEFMILTILIEFDYRAFDILKSKKHEDDENFHKLEKY